MLPDDVRALLRELGFQYIPLRSSYRIRDDWYLHLGVDHDRPNLPPLQISTGSDVIMHLNTPECTYFTGAVEYLKRYLRERNFPVEATLRQTRLRALIE